MTFGLKEVMLSLESREDLIACLAHFLDLKSVLGLFQESHWLLKPWSSNLYELTLIKVSRRDYHSSLPALQDHYKQYFYCLDTPKN